ncbi:MAG: JDVT-CTERM system glutamic-type intramembrane protease [Pseudomonadota bacterium]
MQTFCGGELGGAGLIGLLRLLLAAPLLEEWIIRAGVQEWLIRRDGAGGRLIAVANVVLPACCFSLLHLRAGPLVMTHVLLPGLVLGVVYQHRRDWRVCALIHAGFNGMAISFCTLNR